MKASRRSVVVLVAALTAVLGLLVLLSLRHVGLAQGEPGSAYDRCYKNCAGDPALTKEQNPKSCAAKFKVCDAEVLGSVKNPSCHEAYNNCITCCESCCKNPGSCKSTYCWESHRWKRPVKPRP